MATNRLLTFLGIIATATSKLPQGITLMPTNPTDLETTCGNSFRVKDVHIPTADIAARQCIMDNRDVIDPCTGQKTGEVSLLNQRSIFTASNHFVASKNTHKIKLDSGTVIRDLYQCGYQIKLKTKITLTVGKNVNLQDLQIRENGQVVHIRTNQVLRQLKPQDFTVIRAGSEREFRLR